MNIKPAVRSLDEWRSRFFKGQKAEHWKDGRSAASLARFVLDSEDAALPDEYASIVRELEIEFDGATLHPEFNASFDGFSGPANLDAMIELTNGKHPVAVLGVEAKVDESFSAHTVGDYYRQKRSQNGSPSNVPARIDQLVAAFRGADADPDDADFGYQLLTLTAGTLAEAARRQAHHAVVVIHVFRTDLWDLVVDAKNREDLGRFLAWLGSDPNAVESGGIARGFSFPGGDAVPGTDRVQLYVAKVVTDLRA